MERAYYLVEGNPRRGFLISPEDSVEGENFQYCDGEKITVELSSLTPIEEECAGQTGPFKPWVAYIADWQGAPVYDDAYQQIGEVTYTSVEGGRALAGIKLFNSEADAPPILVDAAQADLVRSQNGKTAVIVRDPAFFGG